MRQKLPALLLTVAVFLATISSFANVNTATAIVLPNTVVVQSTWGEKFKDEPQIKVLSPEMLQMGIDKFLSLTPSKYKEMTGKRLGLKKSLELKVAQKYLKKKMSSGKGADISKGVYILLAILGLGWLAIGLLSDWSGSDWIVNLVLTILCWLPGLIHALVKMKKYYN